MAFVAAVAARQEASAQAPMLNGSAPVVRHEARPGSPLYTERGKTVAVLFRMPTSEAAIEARGQRYVMELKPCSASQVRRDQRGPVGAPLESQIDVLVYNDQDSAQRRAVGHWPRAVMAYRNGETVNEALRRDPLYSFVRTLGVECLPTRVVLVSDAGGEFLEYREGANAFQQ